MFELLCNLNLPLFSRGDWKSTIRKAVRVHQKYHDLEPWNGSETADITYHDTHNTLTELLRGRGYFDQDMTIPNAPMYYLEVKTTVGQCSEAFYMSGSQYRRVSCTIGREE